MLYFPLNKSWFSKGKGSGCGRLASTGRHFLFSIGMIAFWVASFSSCAPKAYKSLHPIAGSSDCVIKHQPTIGRALYQTTVDVAGNHLSGILLIKQMPDSSTRLLFTNEAGFKFFDFEFSKTGRFNVHAILEKMNRDAVIKTLQKDFRLILMQLPVNQVRPYRFKGQKKAENYFAFQDGKDFYYYITSSDCETLLRMERGSNTRKVLEAFSTGLKQGAPETVSIHHNNFNFDIQLKRIYDHAE